jgi:hypothetical protein
MKERFVVWRGTDEWRAEAATVWIGDDGLRATGVQIGPDYRVDYTLDALGPGFVTRRMTAVATGPGFRHELDLKREDMGDSLDCDLGLSPLTNAMPVLRHRLHAEPGAVDFTMAWIDVPSLEVTESAQRYEHMRRGLVRYVDRGRFEGFTAELEYDEDGLAVVYPDLAERAA